MKYAVSKCIVAASAAVVIGLMGAISMAEAGHGGGHGGFHVGGMGHIGGIGHIGSIGHIGGMSHMGHMGHVGHVGHIGPMAHVGHLGHVGHMGHVGHIGHVGGQHFAHNFPGKHFHDHGKFHHFNRFANVWWWGLPVYSYGYGYGGCGWLYRRAVATGSAYWWDRYYACIGTY